MVEVKQSPAMGVDPAIPEEHVNDEDVELQDLYRLLSSSSSRLLSSARVWTGSTRRPGSSLEELSATDSTVPVAVLAKLNCQIENQNKAAQMRRQQQERQQRALDLHAEENQRRRASSATRLQNNRDAVDDMIQRNHAAAQAVRSEKTALGVRRQKQDGEFQQRARSNFEKMRGNDARLDALEEAAAAAERQEATRGRLARSRAFETYRTTLAAERKERADHLRAETHRAVTQRMNQVAASKRHMAQEARADIAGWKALGRREEERRLDKAAACRVQALASHANAATAKEEMVQQRQEEAQEKMRVSRSQVAQAISEREAEQHHYQTRYRKHLASRTRSGAEAVASLASSARLNRDASEAGPSEAREGPRVPALLSKGGLNLNKKVAAANAALYRRIHQVAAAVDHDVMDEEAGAARATMAADSMAQKGAEARHLAEENALYDQMIANAVSKTDDGDGNQTAGEALVADWRNK